MKAAQAWKKLFNHKHIKEHYYEKLSNKTSVGLDKITPEKFESALDDNIDLICRKTNNHTYTFTRYKQLLFIKNAKKPPRAVSVPTVRDKLTLSVLNELVVEVFGDSCKTRLPQLIINEISCELCKYDMFIKLDIKSFYASIDQNILLSKVKKKIRKSEIIDLIKKAIQTESLALPVTDVKNKEIVSIGVPEGLPISNALANIYLAELDKKYKSNTEIQYWRFVDDILILTKKENFEKIRREISNDINKYNLSLNEKKDEGTICSGFEYLGYKISDVTISVRKKSILRIEQSIEELLGAAKPENYGYIEWKLNNKITGFVMDTNKYGWLFFFSQINDLNLLFHLDCLIEKMLIRYDLKEKIHQKRFVRSYHEMKQSLHETKYIPNFDTFTLQQKRNVLKKVYGETVDFWNDKTIEQRFCLVMSREIRDVERDVQNFS